VNSARLVKLSLALSSQDTAEIQAAVSHLKGVIKDFESLEKEIDHVPGYRDRLKALARPTPTQNFDYFSAKSLLADLELKHVNLTGQPVEGASVKDITDIYGAVYSPKDITGNKADFFGNFPKYFEALSKIGQINYAISIDKLKDLYKAKTRSEAVTAAIKDLQEARTKIPSGKYLSLQAMLLEANLELMNAKGVSDKAIEFARGVINKLDNIRDAESNADLKSRAYLLLGRSLALKTQNDPDPELKIVTLKDAIAKLDKAAESAKAYIAITKNKRDMDESFYAELYHSCSGLKSQLAWAYRTLYEDLEEAGSADAAKIQEYKGNYQALLGEVAKSYADALAKCGSGKNHSVYDRNVRPQVIALEQANFEASKISLKESADGKANLAAITGIYDGLKVTLPSDPEQKKYVESLVAKTKTSLAAAQLFLMNNNNLKMTGASEFEYDKDIVKKYAEIKGQQEIAKAELTESEMFYVYQTVIGACTVMLRYAPVDAMKDLESYFNIMKDKKVSLTYDMASAFSLYAMKNNLTADAKYIIDNGYQKVLDGVKDASQERKQKTYRKVYVKVGDLHNWVFSKDRNVDNSLKSLKNAKKYYEDAQKNGDKSLFTQAKISELNIRIATVKDIIRDFAPEARAGEFSGRIAQYKEALKSFNQIIDGKSPTELEAGYKGGIDKKAQLMAYQWKGVIAQSMIDPVKLGIVDAATVKELAGIDLTGDKDADAAKLMAKANEYFDAGISLDKTINEKISGPKKKELGITVASIYQSKAEGTASLAVNMDPVDEKAKRESTFSEAKNIIEEGKKLADSEGDRASKGKLMVTYANIESWRASDPTYSKGDISEKMKDVQKIYEDAFMEITHEDLKALIKDNYVGIDVRSLFSYGDAAAIGAYKVTELPYGSRKTDPLYVNAVNVLDTVIKMDNGRSDISAAAYARKGDLINAVTDETKDDKTYAKGVLSEGRGYIFNALDIIAGTDTSANKDEPLKRVKTMLAVLEGKPQLDSNLVEDLCILVESEVRVYNKEIGDINAANHAAAETRCNAEFDVVSRARNLILKYIKNSFKLEINKTDKYNDPATGIFNLNGILTDQIEKKQNNKLLSDRLKKVIVWRSVLVKSGKELGIKKFVDMLAAPLNTGEHILRDKNGRAIEDTDDNPDDRKGMQ